MATRKAARLKGRWLTIEQIRVADDRPWRRLLMYLHQRIGQRLVTVHVNELREREQSVVDFSQCGLARYADSPDRLVRRAWRGNGRKKGESK